MPSRDVTETPVVFRFTPYAAVATLSLVRTTDVPVLVYWCARKADRALAETLRAAVAADDCRIEIITVDDLQLSALGEDAGIGPADRHRFIIPSLVPHDRALFLNGDVLVRSGLRQLLETDLGACVVGGVPAHRFAHPAPSKVCSDSYLSAAVLLMDLAALRRTGFTEACRAICRSRRADIRSPHQDVVNIHAEGRKLLLDRRWNWELRTQQVSDASWQRLLDSQLAAIIHFTGVAKPWQGWCNPAITRDWKRLADEIGLGPEHYTPATTLRQAYFLATAHDLNGNFRAAGLLKNGIIKRLLEMAPAGQFKDLEVPFTADGADTGTQIPV